jgi:hypothetical protein
VSGGLQGVQWQYQPSRGNLRQLHLLRDRILQGSVQQPEIGPELRGVREQLQLYRRNLLRQILR